MLHTVVPEIQNSFFQAEDGIRDLTVTGVQTCALPILRHLVMPGGIAGTREIMRFLAEELSRDTYVNLMDQYYPAGRVSRERFPEINRRITDEEFDVAPGAARAAGLPRFAPPRRLARLAAL